MEVLQVHVRKDIDEYIAGFPNDVQRILEKIRLTIRKAAPDAEEAIKYLVESNKFPFPSAEQRQLQPEVDRSTPWSAPAWRRFGLMRRSEAFYPERLP
jgi:hypothetical protein